MYLFKRKICCFTGRKIKLITGNQLQIKLQFIASFFFFKYNRTVKTINTSYTFESDKLYHIVVTYDGAQARLLINGTEVIASQAYAKAGDSSTFYVKPFGISDGTNIEGNIEGLTCYFKLYNKVLTDNEIASNYAIESVNRVMDR